jgi:hypothetical protein
MLITFISGVLMADNVTGAPAATPVAAAAGKSNTMLIAGIIAVVIIVALVGVLFLSSGGKKSGTQTTVIPSTGAASTSIASGGSPSTPTQGSNSTLASLNSTLANVSATFAYLDKGCDLSGVTKITVTYSYMPGASQTYIVSNSNITQSIDVAKAGAQPEVTNYTGSLQQYGNLLLEGVCAGSGALSEASLLNGGNTNGQWFTYSYNGLTTYYNIDTSNPNYVSIESRTPDVVINRTTINGVFMYKMNILKKTRSVSSVSTFYIPGSDPMTSESFQAIMNSANATANAKLEYQGMVAEDPEFAQLYGSFASYENATSQYSTGIGDIGWENYTYTFG